MNQLLCTMLSIGFGISACADVEADATTVDVAALGRGAQRSRLISFGDSLSDVGTYDVGTVHELGGGKFTINSPRAKIWTEDLAAAIGLPAPCAAETGLDGDPAQGFYAPVTAFPDCTNYAQGGARVTDPVGYGNKLQGGSSVTLGFLTVPVREQIQHYLALHDGAFSKHDLVTVLVGANDVFLQLAAVSTGTEATSAVAAIASAASELTDYIKDEILAKGAKRVLVLNLPDIVKTPFGAAQDAATQSFMTTMLTTFNGQLEQGLSGSSATLVDTYSFSREQSEHPEWFGLANNTRPACDLSPAVNPIGSSLICTTASLVDAAEARDAFADTVHPTPYQHALYAGLAITGLLAAN
jgi:outer membrane lipase/esterase